MATSAWPHSVSSYLASQEDSLLQSDKQHRDDGLELALKVLDRADQVAEKNAALVKRLEWLTGSHSVLLEQYSVKLLAQSIQQELDEFESRQRALPGVIPQEALKV